MQITLRLTESLHAKVRERARALGRSINSYLVQLIESDLQLPVSQVPVEVPTAKKSPVMIDAEGLLAWSLEHQGEQLNDDTVMEEFGWTERMIPARRSLFKALCRRDPRFKEVRENFIRRAFDALSEMQDEYHRIKNIDRKQLCERFEVSGQYLDLILKALAARDAITLYEHHATWEEETTILGIPCRNRECFGVMGRTGPAAYKCSRCGGEWNLATELLQFLREGERDRKYTTKELREHFNVSWSHVEEALNTLLAKGLLIKDQSGNLRPKENSKPS